MALPFSSTCLEILQRGFAIPPSVHPCPLFLMLDKSWCFLWMSSKFHCVWQNFLSLCMGMWLLSSFIIKKFLSWFCFHFAEFQGVKHLLHDFFLEVGSIHLGLEANAGDVTWDQRASHRTQGGHWSLDNEVFTRLWIVEHQLSYNLEVVENGKDRSLLCRVSPRWSTFPKVVLLASLKPWGPWAGVQATVQKTGSSPLLADTSKPGIWETPFWTNSCSYSATQSRCDSSRNIKSHVTAM